MKTKHWMTGLVAGMSLLMLAACGQQAASPKPTKATSSQSSKKPVVKAIKSSSSSATSSSTSTAAASSSVAETLKPATVQEKLAMVLQAPGAGNYSLATGQTAAPVTNTVTGVPSGGAVYALGAQRMSKTPTVVLAGSDAYLFSTQSGGIPFTWVQQNALHVDLASTWARDHGTTSLEQLAQQLSIVAESQQNVVMDPNNVEMAFHQYDSDHAFTEDSSTVSGEGAQTSGFTQLEGDNQWWWGAHKADGSTAYHMSLTNIQYVGNNTYTADGSQDSPLLDAKLTFIFTSPDQYTVKSTDINYYGTFNR